MTNLDTVLNYLKSVDPDKFTESFRKHFLIAAEKASAEGKITKEKVKTIRKFSIIFSGEVSEAMYDANRKMLDYCKKLKEQKGRPNS
jgi:hypothetical protein